MEKQSTFLDKQTFFALIIILLAWFGWERYMRAKYPPRTPVPQAQSTSAPEQGSSTKIVQEKKEKPLEIPQEKTISFEDDEKKVTLSSHGLGVREVILKNFVDDKKDSVRFVSENSQPFFSIQVSNQKLYFQLKKVQEGKLRGETWYAGHPIRVNVEVQKQFLEYQIEFDPKKIPSIKVVTSIFPKEKAQGFFTSLLSGGRRGLNFFARDFKKNHKVFYSDSDESQLNLSQMKVFGVGGKYFGQALTNHSEVIPSLNFQGSPQQWRTETQYQFSKNIEVSQIRYRTFFGPKQSHELNQVHPELSNWIDLGFLRSLAVSILWFLRKTFIVTKNWGLSIILLTLFVRVLLFPLNRYMYKAMKVMKEIQPEMKTIREKYKKDPRTMQMEILALMKKNNAKPFSMYFPMIVQIPIFIALYRVLGESFELYQAPFFGWVQDLSSKDPLYILPVLMGIAMYFQQRLSPSTNLEPAQEKILRIIPVVFTILLINLPSGLILYILVSTLFGLAQQYYFMKKH